MIPRFRPTLGRADLAALLRIGEADALAHYERAFARALGQAEAVAFPYGRTALRLLLESEGLRDADIICPAYTCVVVPHAIVASGNRPVFIDSGADGNMDLDAAERAIGPATRALIPTAIFGHPVDLDRLDALRARHPGLMIIEDCAHSFACEWKGRPVQADGSAAFYGSNISKIATSIFGGMVTTDDGKLAARLRRTRGERLAAAPFSKGLARAAYLLAAALAFTPPLYSLVDALRRTGLLSRFEDYYDPETIDMPADHLVALSDVEARLGTAQIGRLAAFVAARRAFAKAYRAALHGHPAIRFLPSPPGSSFSHIAAVVADPSALVAAAKRRGIELGRVIDYSCPEMPCYRNAASNGPWPVAGFFARHVVNLPVSGRFDGRLAEKVIATLRAPLDASAPAPATPLPDA